MLQIDTPKNPPSIVAPADVFNTLIMVFFLDKDLVTLLHTESASPFSAGSVIQLFTNARNVLQILIIILTIRGKYIPSVEITKS